MTTLIGHQLGLMSGDIGLLDESGFLYIKDRSKYFLNHTYGLTLCSTVKDMIIRGGENIDCTSVENALFIDGILEVAAVAVPDEKLGELVAAVVSVQPKYRNKITEKALVALARTRYVEFAVCASKLVN